MARRRHHAAFGRSRRDRFDRELRLQAGLSIALGAAAGVRALRAPVIAEAFGDGRAYEAMARGEPGAPPFNRRVLMPALARRLRDDPVAGLRPIALASVAVGTVATGALAARVARECGAPRGRAGTAGVLVAALVPITPHGLRLAAQVPAFNDGLAAALGGVWLLVVTADRPMSSTAAAGLGLAVELTREQWLGVAGAVVATSARLRRRPEIVVGHLVTGAIALAVLVTRPAAPGSEIYPPSVALRRLGSWSGLAEIAWGFVFVLGALPVLLPPALRRIGREPGRDPALAALAVVAGVQGGLSLAGGSDTPRLLHGALLPLLAATVGVAVAEESALLAPVLAVTIAGWRPLGRLEGTTRAYEDLYLPYWYGGLADRLRRDSVRRLGALGAVLATREASGQLRRRRGWR